MFASSAFAAAYFAQASGVGGSPIPGCESDSGIIVGPDTGETESVHRGLVGFRDDGIMARSHNGFIAKSKAGMIT